jgi:hypothetical protein
MAEQMAGAGTVLVVGLGYLLLVQALTAAIVLLAQFIVMQWRSLRTLVSQEPPRTLPAPAREVHQARGDQTHQVVIGGGLRRWE